MELPVDFCTMMRQQYGDEVAEGLFEGLSQEPSVSIRMNPRKLHNAQSSVLSTPSDGDWGIMNGELSPVPWCPDAYYLTERPAFTFDPLFHAGVYYVQEAGSMYLAKMLRQFMPKDRALVALDLCAAPGGKSTLLRSLLPKGSLLVSNEPMPKRAQVLAENMVKWGHPACVVTRNYPADFAPFVNQFDLLVTDVPCSGEGMFRKDEGAIRDWSLENVELCWRRQREILQDIWPTLKPGGLLIYSTCTFNRFEDEDNVAWIARELGAEVLADRHFLPGRDRGEGFYIAALRKKGETEDMLQPSADNGDGKWDAEKDEVAEEWSFIRKETKDAIMLYPEAYATLMQRMQKSLHCLVCGVVQQEKGVKDWVPAQAYAMSLAYQRGSYPEYELSHDEAIAYLRREALRIDAPRGYVLVTYQSVPLGFVKSIGNRANNLYPQEWRIRTTHIPS